MAMVHSQRAVKLDEPLEDGTTHRYEAIEDQPAKKRAAASGTPARRGSTKTRKGKSAKATSEEGEEGEGGEGGDDAEGDADGVEGGSATGGGEGSENLDPALTAGDHRPASSTHAADPSAAEGNVAEVVPSTTQTDAHFIENDFIKQLEAMQATALAEAKQTDGDDTLPGASSLHFVPPPPPPATAPEGDLEVGGGTAGKRAREEEEDHGAEGEQNREQQKKQRVEQQEGDIAVGGEDIDIEVPLGEGTEGDGSYERTRV